MENRHSLPAWLTNPEVTVVDVTIGSAVSASEVMTNINTGSSPNYKKARVIPAIDETGNRIHDKQRVVAKRKREVPLFWRLKTPPVPR